MCFTHSKERPVTLNHGLFHISALVTPKFSLSSKNPLNLSWPPCLCPFHSHSRVSDFYFSFEGSQNFKFPLNLVLQGLTSLTSTQLPEGRQLGGNPNFCLFFLYLFTVRLLLILLSNYFYIPSNSLHYYCF